MMKNSIIIIIVIRLARYFHGLRMITSIVDWFNCTCMFLELLFSRVRAGQPQSRLGVCALNAVLSLYERKLLSLSSHLKLALARGHSEARASALPPRVAWFPFVLGERAGAAAMPIASFDSLFCQLDRASSDVGDGRERLHPDLEMASPMREDITMLHKAC